MMGEIDREALETGHARAKVVISVSANGQIKRSD
jgi:hypothetical protein